MEETPRSYSTPPTRDTPSPATASARREKGASTVRIRSPNLVSRDATRSRAEGSRSMAITDPTPASRRASAWPPAPTVASTTSALSAKNIATSDASAGRCGLTKHPDGQEPQPDVAGHHDGHQS